MTQELIDDGKIKLLIAKAMFNFYPNSRINKTFNPSNSGIFVALYETKLVLKEMTNKTINSSSILENCLQTLMTLLIAFQNRSLIAHYAEHFP